MKKKYILNGKIYYEEELTSYAKKSDLSLDDYIKESGAKEHNDTSVYTLNGKEYDGNTLADYAKKSDLPFDSYLKESGAKKKASGTSLPVPQEDLSKTIPQVSLEKPEDVSVGELKSTESNNEQQPVPTEKTPPDVTPDVIDKVLLANQYASDKSQANISGSTGGAGVSFGKSKQAAAEEKRIKEELKSQGYDVDELTSLYADFPKSAFNQPGYTKQELAQLQKDNPQEFERKIATAKWSIPLQDEIRKSVRNGNISQEDAKIAWDNIHKGYNSKLSYEEGRQQLRDLINDVDKYASSDTKDKIKNNLAQSFANFYGNPGAKGYSDAIKNDPNSEFLDENQLAAFHFLQDTEPKKAEGYSQLLIDKPSQWTNEDAELGWEEKARNLEQIGLGLKLNASKEKLNQLIARSKGDQVFPEDQTKAQDLLVNIDQINQQLQNLDSKYPNIQSYDIGNAAKDITGFKDFNALSYLPLKAKESAENTIKGLWELASRPFRSDENNKINQLEIAGEDIASKSSLYNPKDNTMMQQYNYKFAPELDKQIKDVMLSKSSDEDKYLTVDKLLRENPQDWSKVPIKNGKIDINPSSIWYAVSDLAATLIPFVALETATGGGATAGMTRKIISSFSAAFSTSFHDTYAEAIRQGVANPYGYALRVTGINAAAMSGAGTAAKVKEMLGTKTAVGQLVSNMDDKAIEQILKSSQRSALKDFGIQNLKNIRHSVVSGVEFETMMGAARAANQKISGEKINPEQMMIQGAVGVLNFGMFGLGTSLIGGQKRTVTELQSSTLLKASENPETWIAEAKKQFDDGNISSNDFNQIKKNIETASEVSKNIRYIDDNGNPMSKRKQAEYLALKMQEANLNEENKSDVPEKFAEKIEIKLDEIKTQLQNVTAPEKEEGKEEVTAEEAKKLQKSEYVVEGNPVTEQEFLDAVKNTPDKEIQYTGTNDEYIKMVEKIGGKTVEYFWNDDIAAIPEVDSKVKQLNALIAKGGKEGEDAAAELDLLQQDPEKYFSKDKAIVDKIKSTYEETPGAKKISKPIELSPATTEVPQKTEYETRQEEEYKLYRLQEEADRAKRRIGSADDTDAAIAEWNKAKKERDDFEDSMNQRQQDIKDKNALEGLLYDEDEQRKKYGSSYEYADLYNKDPRLAALQHAKKMLEFTNSDNKIQYLKEKGKSEKEINEDIKRMNDIYTEDINVLEKDLKKNPTKEVKKEKPVKEVKPEVSEVKFKTDQGRELTGESLEIPTHENLDLISVKSSKGTTIYEKATGKILLETPRLDKAEVIEEAKKYFDSKQITAEKVYNKVLKEEGNKVNPQFKVINKSEKYNAHKEQKIAEQKNAPLLYSEDEIKQLQKYKEEAEAKGLAQSSAMIEGMLNQRQTKGSFKAKDINQIRVSLDKEQENKTIVEFKKKNEPLPENLKKTKETTPESLWNAISEYYKKNQLSKISNDIKAIAEKAWRQRNEIFNTYGYHPESMPIFDISNKNWKEWDVLTPLLKVLRAANGKDPKKLKENVAKAEAEVREAAANMDKIYEEEMAKFGKKVAVPEKIGLEGRDESVTLKEMKPFTDKMVEIERQFKNEGYDIDWDHDNDIQILDKEGEQVGAEDLPNKLVKLAAAYEAATKKLADYDQKLYIKSLKESRKVVETEAEVVTPAKKELPAAEAPNKIEDVKLQYNEKGQHLAPNGKPSNLSEGDAKLVRTADFKKWFGDWENDPKNSSKIVDENGEPLIVRHQSQSEIEITKFSDKKKAGIRAALGRKISDIYGIYFTSYGSEGTREMFDKTGKGRQYQGFVNLRNPLILEGTSYYDYNKKEATSASPELFKNEENYLDAKQISKSDKDKLTKLGYDGVWSNKNEGHHKGIDEVIIFNDSQLKRTELPQQKGEGVGEDKGILNNSISVSSKEGRKGLASMSDVEGFVGEDRTGSAAQANSRKIIDNLKKDITENGFKEPIIIVYDKNKGEAAIVEGNHRYIAAKELGLKEIPVEFEKGTLRSNEERAKDNMFPLNRKKVGNIEGAVTGEKLGIALRQPESTDFKSKSQLPQQKGEGVGEVKPEKVTISNSIKQKIKKIINVIPTIIDNRFELALYDKDGDLIDFSQFKGTVDIDEAVNDAIKRYGDKLGRIDFKHAEETRKGVWDQDFNQFPIYESKGETSKVPEVQKEEEAPQFVPLKVTDLEHEKITRDNAIDYEEDEKEGSNGRMYTYTSSITIDVTDSDGNSVGSLIQKKDEDGDITWESQDSDGNYLSKYEEGFNFKDEAMEAIVKAWNKEKKKEFDKEAKKALKAKEKAAKNKKVKKSFQLNTNENLSEDQAKEVAAMFDKKLDDADSIFPDAVTVDGEIDPSVPMQTITVDPKDKRPEGKLMGKLRVPLKFILGKKIGIGMSDTLTTGERTVDTLDPATNKIEKKTIREEGGIGYPFKSLVDLMNGAIAAGKKAMGWAAVGKGAASAMINAAKQADKITGRELKDHYFESLKLTDAEKARLEQAIPDNKEYGLVAIYKMGDDGIKSNEAYSAEAFRQIETKLSEAEKEDFFRLAIAKIKDKKWKDKDKYESLFGDDVKTFAQLDAILHGSNLPLGTKADIVTKVLLSTEETVSTKKANELADLLKSKGITIESVARAIEEPVMKGIDKGQLMILLAIDPDAKSVEDKNKERHKNYPYGVEGFPIGVFDQTTQFHHLSPEMMDTFIKTATATLQSERSKEGQVISMTSEKNDKTGVITVIEKRKVKTETGVQTIESKATDKEGNPIEGKTAAEVNQKLKAAGYKVRITVSQKADGKFYAEEGTGASKQSIFEKGKPLSADSPEQLFKKLKKLNIEIADDVANQRYTQKINGSNYGNLLQKAKKGLIQIFKSPQLTAQQKLVKVLQKAFPGIVVEMNQQQYDSMEEMFRGQALINKTGKAYGFLHDGRVYLDPTYLDNNLPIHEYGHVWNAIAREYRKDIYNKGVSLVGDSKYFDFVLNDTNYKRLIKQAFGNDILKLDKETKKYIINPKSLNAEEARQYVADEALSKAIGDRGQLFVDQAQKMAFVKWLEALYNAIKKIIGFENMTPEQFQQLNLKQFVDAALKELLSGKPISDVTSKQLAQITKESGTKFSVEENKEPEGVGISKAKLLEQYGFTKGFDTRESQDVAMGVMNTINNAAKKNNLTAEQQAAYEVTVMRSQGSDVAPTDHNIITAGKHLLDIDKKIKDAMDANDNNQVQTLLRQRDEAASLLRQLGNNAGRNLGLFALIFNNTSNSELTVTRYGLQRALGVSKVPETITELENSNLTAEEQDKVRPYIQEIEKLNKQITDIEEEMKKKVISLNDEELKRALKEAYEQGRKAGIKFMSGKKEKKSQQLKDLASKLRSSDEFDKFINNMTNVQKKGIDLGSYKEMLANILDGVAAVVDAGENINEYLRKAVEKIKDTNIDKKELLKDAEMLVARATLPPVKETLKKIKRIAKTEKAKSITESMVDKGLISDLIDTLIASEVPAENIIEEVTKQLKVVLPNVTAEDVADAFVGRNQFKKESKQQLKTSVAQKREELKRLTVKEEKLKALEAANNYHLAKTKEDKEKIRSNYEKELDARIQKAKFGEDIRKIKEEIDFINSNKTVFRKAIKEKAQASTDLMAAREALRQTYIQNGLRVETGDKSPIAVEQAYQDQLKRIDSDSSLSDAEKTKKIAELKAQKDLDLIGTKQGVISNLTDSLNELINSNIDKANEAFLDGDTELAQYYNDLNNDISDIHARLAPTGENLADLINRAYRDLNKLADDKSLSKEDRQAISDIIKELEFNNQLASDQLAALKLKKQWQSQIDASNTKINSGLYTEIPVTPFDFRRQAALSVMNRERQNISGRLKSLVIDAQQKNKTVTEKAFDLSTKLLVSGAHTTLRVAEAASFKPFIDAIVENTTGRIASLFTGADAATLKSIKEGFKTFYAFKNKEQAAKYILKLEDIKVKALEDLENAHLSGDKKEISKAEKAFLKADLNYAISTIYASIEANAFSSFWDYLAHGVTDYDVEIGKGLKKKISDYRTVLGKTGYVLEGWIRMHGAEKSTISARPEMLRTFATTLQQLQSEGKPLSEENIAFAMVMASNAYDYGRMTNKTAMSNTITQLKQSKYAAVKYPARFIFPVSTIAINIGKRAIDYSSLGTEGWIKLASETRKGMKLNEAEGQMYNTWMQKMKAGIEKIPLEQRKYINGVIARGLFGVATSLITLWGLANGQIKYGGTWDDQRRRKIYGSDGEVLKANEWEFFGWKSPKLFNSFLLHTPEALNISLMANWYQIDKLDKGKGTESKDQVKASFDEVVARFPFMTVLGMAKDPLNTVIDRFTRVPLLKEIGDQFDENAEKRDKSTPMNRIRSNIGLGGMNEMKAEKGGGSLGRPRSMRPSRPRSKRP